MGAWGTGLYSDDTTCDVRDKFKANLEAGFSYAEAERAVLLGYSDVLQDHQVACLVYFSLADTEWKYGCLSEQVKRYALMLLDGGGDVRYWLKDNPGEAKSRAKVLGALSSKLEKPQPPLKLVALKVRRPPKKQIESPVGSVFGLPLPGGEVAVLKFVGLRPVGNVLDAVFRLLPWKGASIAPDLELGRISHQTVTVCDHHEFSILMDDGRKKLTTQLMATGIVLETSSPIDTSRSVVLSIGGLAENIQNALAIL